MHPLNRKLIRDLYEMRGQAVAIVLVIASGIATFVMSLSTLTSLRNAQASYYQRTQFAEVFTRVKRAPRAVESRIAAIDGVGAVETRVVVDVNLDVPHLREPAVGRLISIPDRREPSLNRLYLRQGRYPEPGRTGEALVSEAFAKAHGFKPGDRVKAIVNGRLYPLTIVGVALSPEYVLAIRVGDVLPDQRFFGIFWLREQDLAAAYNMEGAFNDVTLTLMRGASVQNVLDRLDDLLERYGSVGAIARKDQLSHRFLSDEIKQLRAMGMIAPSIFLSVAAFLLNVVMTRIVSAQREQIAALKAFGYSNLEIGRHYLRLAVLITIFGVALGVALGAWMGMGLTRLYTTFYHFPVFGYDLQPSVALLAVGIGVGAAMLGTLGAIWRAVSLPPAQAMRPEPPTSYRPTVIERLGLQRLFTESARMILRHLERRPIKSFFSSLGISLAVAVLVLGRFGTDAMDYLVRIQFYTAQQQDMIVTFTEPASADAVNEIARLPGVQQVEPFRAISAEMRFGHRVRRAGITGLSEPSELYRIYDAKRGPIALPEDGLVLSNKLAELLDVQAGQVVKVDVQEGRRPVREIPVVGTVEDFSGANAFMNAAALHRLMQEGGSVSGVHLKVDADLINDLYTTLKRTPRVAGVTVKKAMLESFDQTIRENQRAIETFNFMFAVVIAFGVVYNTARISLAERTRELCTLRVMGFTRAEVSAILLGELAVLTLAAIPLGCAIGYGFAAWASMSLNTEIYRIPLIVTKETFGFAAAVVLMASIVSGLVVRRRLDRLDLVAALKAGE